jgi:tetratricopeptide (TPR) repeat protein
MENRSITIWFFTFVALLVFFMGCAGNRAKQDQADIHKNIGIAYLGSGQFTEALKEFILAKEHTPKDPQIHYFLGVAYHEKNLNDKAIKEFKKAIDLKANYSEVYNYLGMIYMDIGLLDKAIDSFNQALANILYETPAAALYNMGAAYYKKGMYETALAKYNEAIVKEPNSILVPLIEKNTGITLLAQGNEGDAIKHFKKSLELSPSLIESQYWLGVCFLKVKNFEAAKSAFESVIKLAPESDFGIKAKESLKSLATHQ